MFDVTSSKLLILGVVALLVVGPKDLPALLRTIGRYMGIIKRHAAEFRAQFDEAMREAELDQIKKEVDSLGSTTEAHMRAAQQSLEAELARPSGSVGEQPSPSAAGQVDAQQGATAQLGADEAAPGADGAELGEPEGAAASAQEPAKGSAKEDAQADPAPARAPEKSGA